MSESEPAATTVKSEDKREIEDEEREKMLNQENKAEDLPPPVPDTPLPDSTPGDEAAPEPPSEDEAAKEEKEEKKDEPKEAKEKKLKLPKVSIKMPSFLRNKSRERAKDGEGGAAEESKDLLQGAGSPDEAGATSPTGDEEAAKPEGEPTSSVPKSESMRSKLSGVLDKVKLPSNPFKKNKSVEAVELEEPKEEGEGDKDKENKEKEKDGEKPEGEGATPAEGSAEEKPAKEEKPVPVSRKTRLLEAIRAPLAAVFPRKSKPAPTEKDAEAGDAEAPVDEKCVKDDKGADVEDGLETVKLENAAQDAEQDPEKGAELQEGEPSVLDRMKAIFFANKWLIIGIGVFLLLLLIIVVLAISGPRYPRYTEMLIDGRYINAITSCGLVQGLLDEGEYVFRGIPYAVPPVNERRFAPAEPLNKLEYCWNGTFRAWRNETENGPEQCWQTFRNRSLNGNEDCLTLDVYTRKVKFDAPLPVVFLVSTETLVGGHTWRPARGMARQKDVVFVQPRFRLGPLGFLAANVLSRSTYPPRSGNYALTDLIAALEWVQINIEHFGGDPDSVTIVGHRGGASLVTALTTLPKRRGAVAERLFKQVWVSSGSGVLPSHNLNQAESHGKEFVSAVGCSDVRCLRRVEAEDIVDAIPEDWRPQFVTDLPTVAPVEDQHQWIVQDGVIVQQDLYQAWADNGLPYKMVIGATAHAEASPEMFIRKDWSQKANFDNHVRSSVLGTQSVPNGLLAEVLSRYKPTSWAMMAAMISDVRTICPLYSTARRIATTAASSEKSYKNPPSVHFYVVTQTRNTSSGVVADVGSDIDVFLGLYEARSPEQKRYLAAMQGLFYRFVYHGEMPPHPTGTGRSSALPNSVLVVNQDVIVQPTYQNCDLWIERQLAPLYGRVE